MSTESPLPVKWAPVWRVQCGVLCVLGGFAWWQLPGGFPWSHPRFWMNGVLTLLVSALCAGTLYALWKRNIAWFCRGVATLAAGAIGMALAAPWAFPVTMTTPKALAAIGAIVAFEGLSAWRALSGGGANWLVAAIVGFLVGAAVPWSQRGPNPTTSPSGREIVTEDWNWGAKEIPAWAKLDDRVGVSVHDGGVKVLAGGAADKSLTIEIEPLLTFISSSPDRCWSILAPLESRDEPRRQLFAARQAENSLAFAYRGAHPQRLHMRRDPANDATEIEATTVLETAVYSHLNSYCALTIYGHKRLTLRFSPVPAADIEPLPFDYPRGRPIRLAYFKRPDFRVVEASSGEKGPFAALAESSVANLKKAPLTITLCDEGVPICDVRLFDWFDQVSHEPSPTAGWGLPQNAIEFARTDESPSSPVQIWITLAGTSVGRGWDTVGHGPGIYSNRMTVSPAK